MSDEHVRRVGDTRPLNTKGCITIQEAIERLIVMREHSLLGGETALAWCGIGSELDTMNIVDMKLEVYEEGYGALVMCYTDGPRTEET